VRRTYPWVSGLTDASDRTKLERMRGPAYALGVLFVLGASWIMSPLASAAEIKVTETTDDFFAGSGGACSLREAIQGANTDGDFGGCDRTGGGTADTIKLRGGSTYARTRAGIDDTNQNGDLDIAGDTTFEVRGAGVATIDGGSLSDRVLHVLPSGRLDGSRLLITGGELDGPQTLVLGGGLLSQGRLRLQDSEVSGNVVTTNAGCPCGGGVGISDGKATLNRVLVTDNLAQVNLGGGIAQIGGDLSVSKSSIVGNFANRGAGIALGGFNGSTLIRDTTVAGNEALQQPASTGGGVHLSGQTINRRLVNVTISGNKASAEGGGIYLFSGGLKVNAATITENTADADENGSGDGGGILSANPVEVENSIIAGNVDFGAEAADCAGSAPVAAVNSLVVFGGGCFEGGSNVSTNGPKLKPLGDYGGPTTTHALMASSKAIGRAGDSAPGKDQRGKARDSQPDIGAFER
jgi:CSLREA domain-containing protein